MMMMLHFRNIKNFQFLKSAATAATATTLLKKYHYKLKTGISMIKMVAAGSSKVAAGSSRIGCCYPVAAQKVRNKPKNDKVAAVAAVAQEIHI
jgi:hypothetical protein